MREARSLDERRVRSHPAARNAVSGAARHPGSPPHLAVGPRLRRAPSAHAGHAGFVSASRRYDSNLENAILGRGQRKGGLHMSRLLRAILCCALALTAAAALAQMPQPWPSRAIRLIVPTGPGAATDVMARLLADGISR